VRLFLRTSDASCLSKEYFLDMCRCAAVRLEYEDLRASAAAEGGRPLDGTNAVRGLKSCVDGG
jgi:hypothetical protein